ncbi:hypothetical protein LXL04_018515 [Taraxacum kok-saghyz]
MQTNHLNEPDKAIESPRPISPSGHESINQRTKIFKCFPKISAPPVDREITHIKRYGGKKFLDYLYQIQQVGPRPMLAITKLCYLLQREVPGFTAPTSSAHDPSRVYAVSSVEMPLWSALRALHIGGRCRFSPFGSHWFFSPFMEVEPGSRLA